VIAEKDTVPVPKHFSAHPGYHGLNDDSFMYSIHGTVKDEAPSQLVEEKPADMMCMFDDIPYLDCPPKWDQYDDDHEAEMEVVCSEKWQHVIGRKKIIYRSDATISPCTTVMTAMGKRQKISE
jgi:hypothetical protein